MSLITASSASADFRDQCRHIRAARRKVGIEQQTGHADDAVHGRADLVAHVGQEFALGIGGCFGGGNHFLFGGYINDGADHARRLAIHNSARPRLRCQRTDPSGCLMRNSDCEY